MRAQCFERKTQAGASIGKADRVITRSRKQCFQQSVIFQSPVPMGIQFRLLQRQSVVSEAPEQVLLYPADKALAER